MKSSSEPLHPARIRVVVAGSRTYNNYREFSMILTDYLNTLKDISDDVVLISGKASRGPDEMVIRYAEENGYECLLFPAQWNELGRSAGYLRNQEMANVCTHALIFWDGMSKGTKHMIDICRKRVNQVRPFVVFVTADHDTEEPNNMNRSPAPYAGGRYAWRVPNEQR